MGCGVNQLFWATWPLPVVRHARSAVPCDLGPIPRDGGSTSSPGYPAPWSEGSRCLTAAPGDSGPGLKARRVDQMSWVTRVRFQGPAMFTSRPGRLGPGSECPQCRPALPGDSGQGPRACGSTSCLGRVRPVSEGPRGRPEVPGDSCPGPRACRVDQLSRLYQARVGGPEVSTNSPG